MPSRQPDNWECPGCSAPVVYKGYARRGKYCTRDCYLSHKSQLRKEETKARRALRLSLKPPKRGNLFCRQCNKPLPKYGKVYCSPECNYNSRYHPKYADRVPPKYEAEKTARNIEEAPLCSICQKSTARKGWYKSPPHPKIPEGIELCSTHRRSFSAFISQNSYENLGIDELWTVYLVKLTFANAGGRPWMVMIRDAFRASESRQLAPDGVS